MTRTLSSYKQIILHQIYGLVYCIFFDNLDVQNLLSVVTSLLAFAHFSKKDYDKVLETLAEESQMRDVGFNDLYLKG